MQDAVSLLWAGGELTRLQRTRQQAAAAEAAAALPREEQRQAMVAHLASHIAQLIQASNNTASRPSSAGMGPQQQQQQAQEPWHAEDLADVVAGLAAAGYASPAAARLLDAAGHEVYRQLSNRHSVSAGGFSMEAVVTLLGSYATLHYSDGACIQCRVLHWVAHLRRLQCIDER